MTQERYTPLLTDITKQYISEDHPPVPRRIVAAANYHQERDVMLVGSRHWSDAMRRQADLMGLKGVRDEWQEGFIDQWDQFVDRKTAALIVKTNGQETRAPLDEIGVELYSEDCW